ncbi:zinc-binding alcohol dehydrogenase family protein [Gallibacterium anatis]|uniref:Zinc-binding alcohol dehydrogenase family protein n=2 Tax=Gallibacterium anatis TaxID=750 RepID=A0AAX3XEW9_9PAST|nr:zinc-binding alcohol dehydrogenase family protein [Gallibacterium anatis]KGQ24508.1 galactonate oxidoreductase [Gallibacterium anatis]KGQ33174.1 galactonate oxidoreductase [Gallibacterium anatis]KGQ44655.1 galactonate oxidoreductase [Gallibacterium anatis]KGQ52363.1 galactonate oxidoreductase [Gallibacterium anatis 10672-6]MDK9430025.1 zinc-binding alcohol dehydrogenase family protein [Gallibacterium anatis]
MKALVCNKPFEFSYKQLSTPTIKEDQVLLKVAAVGICGTDIHAFGGNQPFFSYPRILGHEASGIIADIGSKVSQWKVGQRVALIPYVSCGECDACRSGRTNCCEKISVIGVHEDGAFSEYLAAPARNILAIDDQVDDITAALIEPFAISAHAVRRAEIKAGDDVLIVGAGPIGLGAAAIAAADGANVAIADTSAERREHIKTQLKLPAFNPIDEKVENFFNGKLPLIVIDATGNQKAMNNDVNLIRHGGRIVFVGLFKGDFSIHDPDFHKKETTLLGSRNATPEDFEKVQSLMAQGKLSASMMLTHTFKFDQLAEVFEEQVVNNKALIKSVVTYK